MATGGTIPSNRIQSVTFYNTTGVIEKEKNVYYVPRFSKTGATVGQEVRTAYLNAFNVVCPPSSAYTDINISQWSPQDKTLVVRGNVDDFRAVTDEGACLNYFIITRTISKTSGETTTSQTFYYGFFITGVEQAGGGSVRITAEPDDFTNVFYLHNKVTLTSVSTDYEPFNSKMKNCYVNRQHYNRVKNPTFKSVYNCLLTPFSPLENIGSVNDIISFRRLTIQGEINYGNFKILSILIAEGQVALKIEDQNTSRATVNLPTDFSSYSIYNVNQSAYHSVRSLDSWRKNESESEANYQNDNIKILLNQKESFNFKYQYRDIKYPISLNYNGVSNFTKAEISAIENEDTFTNLSSDLQSKIILSCLSFVVIEFKSNECIGQNLLKDRYDENNVYGATRYKTFNLLSNRSKIRRASALMCVPFIDVPYQFEKYNLSNIPIKAHLTSKRIRDNTTIYTGFPSVNFSIQDILSLFYNSNYADYINSVYVTNNINIRGQIGEANLNNIIINATAYFDERINVTTPTEQLNPSVYTDIGSGCLLFGLYPQNCIGYSQTNSYNGMVSDGAFGIHIEYPDGNASINYPMLCLSGENEMFAHLKLEENRDFNIYTDYYDPVLESEPYSFYSVSHLSSIEQTFNKLRYFNGNSYSNLDVYLFEEINGGIKSSIIPEYTVDNVKSKYFNEGSTFVVIDTLPIVSEAYQSYYYQNMAQMKNQFAVNDYNRSVDLLQHFLISGPNAVGYSAGKRGPSGAGLETANQVMQMADEAVDWAQSNKVIEMNLSAKLADMGRKPDNLKSAGSDAYFDLATGELHYFLNHYTIDSLSYNSIAKLLERVGYQVNLYDDIHAISRVGWDYVKLNGFDFNPSVNIMTEQEDSIRKIFSEGVTLLHNKSYLTSGHNYETILDE